INIRLFMGFSQTNFDLRLPVFPAICPAGTDRHTSFDIYNYIGGTYHGDRSFSFIGVAAF
ncbi:hypothetical protein, partial [Hominenteromicrobium sp.]|uniref:hypothetical protein n=1 Tax=Hominenteromicrobium sp. TaxID=3073581 RepID=UPI003A94A8D6